MSDEEITSRLDRILEDLVQITDTLAGRGLQAVQDAAQLVSDSGAAPTDGGGVLLAGITVFVLACFVGYYVVWAVTPALHSPLMAVTNAISSAIIVGALIAAGSAGGGISPFLGLIAVFVASINIVGGFAVTWRMLAMFRKKP